MDKTIFLFSNKLRLHMVSYLLTLIKTPLKPFSIASRFARRGRSEHVSTFAIGV